MSIPESEEALALYEVTQELTSAAGLPAYEISNHAAPGEESRHNLLYWRYGEYAGCRTGRARAARLRRCAARDLHRAHARALGGAVERQGHGWVEQVPVSLAEQADEMLLMGLRLSEGIDLDRLAATSGQSPREPVLAALEHDGLIERIAKNDVSPAQSSWPDEIKACVGPGMRPAADVARPFGRIRATKKGRFVLNEIVLRISESFIPVTVAPAAAAPS